VRITPHGLQAARIGACSTWPGIEQGSDAEGHAIASLQLRAAHLDAEGRCERSVVFALADAAWTEFTAILDRPAKRIPELAALLSEPAPWDE